MAGSSSTGMSTTDSILAQSLPSTLAAPRGWHSEILDSAVGSKDVVYSSTAAETSHVVNQIPTPTQHIVHGQTFGATNHANLHDQRTYVTHHDQTQYVQNVETQQDPPLVLHRSIPNNKVTYQQNVSVRYLQPPTPPPPGPIIIRQDNALSSFF